MFLLAANRTRNSKIVSKRHLWIRYCATALRSVASFPSSAIVSRPSSGQQPLLKVHSQEPRRYIKQPHSLFLSSATCRSETMRDDATTSVSTYGPSAVRSQQPLETDSTEVQMVSFYKFEHIENTAIYRDALFDALKEIPGLRGTIYLAQEGINVQMAVPPDQLDDALEAFRTSLPYNPFSEETPNIGDLVPMTTPTFNRLVVRNRDYVLRDGIPEDIVLDWNDAGLELEAADWHNSLSSSQEPTLLDCRNQYESDEGSFKGATPLETNTFQDSWSQLDDMTKGLPKEKPVYIFCTGGIRCVKVGAYLKQKLGFDNVKRLKHGIIGYQQWVEEEKSNEESVWEGENFLFDKRQFQEKDGATQ